MSTPRNSTLALGLALLMACASLARTASKPVPSANRAERRLEQLKALAGTWVKIAEDGQLTDEVASVYRVTAGGTAVMETVFPGGPMEMITLYHVDGEQLMLTHYCMVGNQPSMHENRRAGGKQKLVFECVGGTGMSSEDETHMHHATLVLKGPDRLSTKWLMVEKGEVTYTAAFELARLGDASVRAGTSSQ